MPIKLAENKDRAALEQSDVVIHELLIGDLFNVITKIELNGDLPWQKQAEDVFYAIMNRMITVDGQHKRPDELRAYPLDFFIEVLRLAYPYFMDTIWPQLQNLLSMASASQK